jgi:sugar lactone lactonase YvrE
MAGLPHASTCSSRRWLAAAAVLLALSACGGGGSNSPAPVPPPAPATLTLAGSSPEVLAGGKPVALTATASANAGTLNWSLGAGNPGSLSATTGATVNYLPPAAAAVSANTPVTITASGNGVSKTFALMLYPDPGPAGVSLIAGNPGGAAVIDGAGSEARFWKIGAVASNAAGHLLVTELTFLNLGPQIFRKVSPQGVVTTMTVEVAQTDPKDGGRPNDPSGITLGPDGTVYFLYKHAVRKIDAAGNGVLVAFTLAVRVLADSAGNLYLMENDLISKVSPGGVVTAFAGTRDGLNQSIDGQGAAARFAALRDMTIDRNGNLFVIDGAAVRRVTPDGTVTTVAGTAVGFHSPQSIAADADGSLLVLDTTGEEITPFYPYKLPVTSLRRVSPAGLVSTVKTGLTWVEQVRVDGTGRVLLVSKTQLSVLGADGGITALAGMQDDTTQDIDGRGAQARLLAPQSIAAEPGGQLYVIEQPYSDPENFYSTGREGGLRLRRIAPDGAVVTLSAPGQWWGKPGASGPDISTPSGMAIDRQGNLYISEKRGYNAAGVWGYAGSIVKITPNGVISVFAGKHNSAEPDMTFADGPADTARFYDAAMLGFDADGNLYVDDQRIRKITPGGMVSTVAALPAGFGADADGNLYVAEGSTVTRIAPNGGRSVVAGLPGITSNKLGALPGILYGGNIARIGPASFAVISGSAIVKLVLPH